MQPNFQMRSFSSPGFVHEQAQLNFSLPAGAMTFGTMPIPQNDEAEAVSAFASDMADLNSSLLEFPPMDDIPQAEKLAPIFSSPSTPTEHVSAIPTCSTCSTEDFDLEPTPCNPSMFEDEKSDPSKVKSAKTKKSKKRKSRDEDESEKDLPEKPKRPLNAYNLFFRHERGQLLASLPVRAKGKPRNSHGKLGFEDMARHIGSKWKAIDATNKAKFDSLALKEKERYRAEMGRYREQVKEIKAAQLESRNTVPAECTKSSDGESSKSPAQRSDSPPGAWSIAELAEKLGHDGVNIVVRAFW